MLKKKFWLLGSSLNLSFHTSLIILGLYNIPNINKSP